MIRRLHYLRRDARNLGLWVANGIAHVPRALFDQFPPNNDQAHPDWSHEGKPSPFWVRYVKIGRDPTAISLTTNEPPCDDPACAIATMPGECPTHNPQEEPA